MDRNRGKQIRTLAAAAVLAAAFLCGCTNERLEDELAYRKVGISSMQAGDYEGAIAAFNGALSCCVGEIGETEIDICYYKAAAQYASGDTEGALATYSALIDYDKKDANAYYLRGCLLLGNGETEAAQEDFANAVAYNSGDYELYIHIYENLSAHNLQAEGEEYLNKAFEIKGDSAENLAYRGKIYYLLGQNENALKELGSALEKKSVDANLTIAQVYEALGDSGKAETHYKAYVESGAADSGAMNALAEIEMAKQNYTGALAYINQGLAMETVTNQRELMQNQIICMEYSGDFGGAWRVIQEYVTLYPEDTEAGREYIFLKNRQAGTEAEQEDTAGEPSAEDTGAQSTEDAGEPEEGDSAE